MKHIFISLICAVLLFSYIGHATMPERLEQGITVANVAKVATAAVVNPTEKKEGRSIATMRAVQQQQVGMLLCQADDIQIARFKKSFEKGLASSISLKVVDTQDTLDAQMTMIDKMIDHNYNLIVLQLTSTVNADALMSKISGAGIPLIITGTEPPAELMQQYPNVYYVGFNDDSMYTKIAEEIQGFFTRNPKKMNFEKDDWDLSYSSIMSKSFAETGKQKLFEEALETAGMTSKFEVDSVVRHYDYNLHKEIDQTIIQDSEIVFYDSSTEAQKAINYYYDPTEFTRRPKQQLVLTVIDEGTAKLVEEKEVLLAVGPDATQLGNTVARLAHILLYGDMPTYDNMSIAPSGERSFYLKNTVLRADIPPEETAK